MNFSERITATPTAYGLDAADASSYATLHSSYSSGLAACDPGERSKTLVAAKNAARSALKNSARLLAKRVEGTASVTAAQKIELGLNVRAMPTPIPPPAHAPALDIVSVSGRTVRIRLHDSTGASRRGKPAGVAGATIFSYVGQTAPTDPAEYKFEGNTTRTIIDVVFPDTVAPGAVVWLTAFWRNERDQSGPACAAISTNIQFGVPMAA